LKTVNEILTVALYWTCHLVDLHLGFNGEDMNRIWAFSFCCVHIPVFPRLLCRLKSSWHPLVLSKPSTLWKTVPHHCPKAMLSVNMWISARLTRSVNSGLSIKGTHHLIG